jgi:hypothetical protein
LRFGVKNLHILGECCKISGPTRGRLILAPHMPRSAEVSVLKTTSHPSDLGEVAALEAARDAIKFVWLLHHCWKALAKP